MVSKTVLERQPAPNTSSSAAATSWVGLPTQALGDRRYHLRPIAEFVLVSLYTETGALRIVLSVTPAPVRLERGIL